jgi:predicted RNA-binding protein with PUA-like domain
MSSASSIWPPLRAKPRLGGACAIIKHVISCATGWPLETRRFSITRVALNRASRSAYPDQTQFDPKSPYFDPKAERDKPRWFNVDVTLAKKVRLVGLPELRAHKELAAMRVLQRGNRLSIAPVESREWDFVIGLL